MTFSELIEAIQDYAEIEGMETIEVLNQLYENEIPGLADAVDAAEGFVIPAFDTVN